MTDIIVSVMNVSTHIITYRDENTVYCVFKENFCISKTDFFIAQIRVLVTVKILNYNT